MAKEDLKAYRHRHTGAIRMSRSTLGYPYSPADAGQAGGLEDLTVAELKEIAAAKGIDGSSSMRKADLVEAIKSHGGTETES